MDSKRDQIWRSLREKRSRDVQVEEGVNCGIAFQIRSLREARGWTQAELGRRVGMKQEAISKLEDFNRGWLPSTRTLVRLANAFDVALICRFGTFSEFTDYRANLSPEDLKPPNFEQEDIVPSESMLV